MISSEQLRRSHPLLLFLKVNHERGRREGACSQRQSFVLLTDIKSACSKLSPHAGHLTCCMALQSTVLEGGTPGLMSPGPWREFSLGLPLSKTDTLL